MTKEEFEDIYSKGYWAALEEYGVWRAGEQTIGCMEKPIRTVFKTRDTDQYYLDHLEMAWSAIFETP